MSTAAVSTSSIYQELQSYFQQRGSDLQQLGQALQSGDLAGAQQEFSAIQNLGQSGPFANGNAFKVSQREQDFAAIGQALQAGDLAGARQAFAQLKSTFQSQGSVDPPAVVVNLSGSSSGSSSSGTSGTSAASSTGSATGTEIVLNLGNVTPGEQITIGVSNASNGTEQVTIGVANQQNQSPEQITLNFNQGSNQQIILNLFNSTASGSGSSSAAQGSGFSVTA
jgi:hypothetical protein